VSATPDADVTRRKPRSRDGQGFRQSYADHAPLSEPLRPTHSIQVVLQCYWGPQAFVNVESRHHGSAITFGMTSTPPTPFDLLGGEAGIRRLVERFYDLIDSAPEAATIRTLHAKSLKSAREKLYLYLTGWTGGPQVYVEKYGHPRLRARHLPFPIGTRERDEWLWCMDRALAEQDMPDELRTHLRERFHALADHMRNAADA